MTKQQTNNSKCRSIFKLRGTFFLCQRIKKHKGKHKFNVVWNDEDAVTNLNKQKGDSVD